jgi:O-antigen ligase
MRRKRVTEKQADRDSERKPGTDSLALTRPVTATTSRLFMSLVLFALLATAFLVDPWADASFDAPKWLAFRLCAVFLGVLLVLRVDATRWLKLRGLKLSVVLLLAFAFLWSVVSAALSPYPLIAWPAFAAMSVAMVYFFVGASTLFTGTNARGLFIAFLVVSTVTAVISLVQAAGLQLPGLSMGALGGRYPTGALLGNEGFVALLCALSGASAVGLFVADEATPRVRWIAAGVCLIAVATIVVNQQSTAAIGLVVGAGIVLAVRWRAHGLIVAGVVVAVLVFASIAQPALRSASWMALPNTSIERYQALTTYRLGAWVAASEMIGAAPWFGRGPGAFAVESTARRLDAEKRFKTRFLQPKGATFVQAHQDWLQLAAEVGLPAAVALCAALGLTGYGVIRRRDNFVSAEPLVIVGMLGAASVASLAWFPMQISLIALVTLIAAGRAWALLSPRDGALSNE